ncbi:MAG TPA: DUF427 domain-containing protein [Ilumatobacteraceae bacterium]|nr:DUF427 domain-containing protein [Ilumatobacteraceae bacterium]
MSSQRIEPGPGQESVWDYPRPPIVSPYSGRVRVVHAGVTIAETTAALRVLETSQPPAFYLPPADVAVEMLKRSPATTWCEWKGAATYWDLGDISRAAWSYEQPVADFAAIAGYLAFYAQKVDECWVDDERVRPNPGMFYGGWITAAVVGPFKGDPGSQDW